jgi:hypothetical protein
MVLPPSSVEIVEVFALQAIQSTNRPTSGLRPGLWGSLGSLARRGRLADGSWLCGFGGDLLGSPPEKILGLSFFLLMGVCYRFVVAARLIAESIV